MGSKSCILSGMFKLKSFTRCVGTCDSIFHNKKNVHTCLRKWISSSTSIKKRQNVHPTVNRIFHEDLQKVLTFQYGRVLRPYSVAAEPNDSLLLNHLFSRIKAGGPLTIADYMREVLTNPQSGYYMHKDVFGSHGDFITSPEITQIFGEMFGVWVVNEWMNHYDGQEIQVVELGPGRGTLADDMLRVFSQFPAIKDKISLHLVEVSPTLGSMQASKLSGRDPSERIETNMENVGGAYAHCKSKYGQDIYWYQNINDVPKGLSCFIAHEFLDALPIHKFQKTDRGWCEILVDIDESQADARKLRYVLSPGDTAGTVAYLKPTLNTSDEREHVEVSPGSGLVVQTISNRIKTHGGFALVADYGHSGEKTDTFRAFKDHKLHDPLVDPGTADLTADIDFSYLHNFGNDAVTIHGPITQEKFLTNMGIGVRLQVLLKNATTDQWSSLISGFRMITSPDQMGERFKFMAVVPKSQTNYNPAGFIDLKFDEQ